MGQKVHPLGFRLTTTQTHRSVWFSRFADYPQFLEEDHNIRTYFDTFRKKAAIANIIIKRNFKRDKIAIEINSARPGVIVGHSGSNLSQIYKDLEKLVNQKSSNLSPKKSIDLNIIEISKPDTEAILLSDFIVEQLEKRVAFRRAIRETIKRSQVAGVQGIKIQISGRLNGAEMARTEWIRKGRVPLHTLRADIDYAESKAHTIYGLLGVKVWLFKGEIL